MLPDPVAVELLPQAHVPDVLVHDAVQVHVPGKNYSSVSMTSAGNTSEIERIRSKPRNPLAKGLCFYIPHLPVGNADQRADSVVRACRTGLAVTGCLHILFA